ncbi:MAG: glycosyltransferase family 2 protein [Alphaproteobacteria bacterium]
MKDKSPLVSVIIPCYNQEKYILDAINSVLDSTYKNVEIIVVDDGSSDISWKILSGLSSNKIKSFHITNSGVCYTRNFAISQASGDYILPLDADDLIYPSYIEKALNIIEKDNNIGLVYSKSELFGEKEGIWNLPNFSLKNILNNNCIPVCALFRKKDFLATNGFEANMKFGLEDWNLWLSFIELHKKIVRIDDIGFKYRISKNTRTYLAAQNHQLMIFNLINNHLQLYAENSLLLKAKYIRILCKPDLYNKIKSMGYFILLKLFFARLKIIPSDVVNKLKLLISFSSPSNNHSERKN